MFRKCILHELIKSVEPFFDRLSDKDAIFSEVKIKFLAGFPGSRDLERFYLVSIRSRLDFRTKRKSRMRSKYRRKRPSEELPGTPTS
jgi:hypothetical protein